MFIINCNNIDRNYKHNLEPTAQRGIYNELILNKYCVQRSKQISFC